MRASGPERLQADLELKLEEMQSLTASLPSLLTRAR